MRLYLSGILTGVDTMRPFVEERAKLLTPELQQAWAEKRISNYAVQELAWQIRANVQYRCFSFFKLYEDSPANEPRDMQAFTASILNKRGIMLDSGAHSLQKIHSAAAFKRKVNKGATAMIAVDTMLEAYIKFCHEWRDNVDFYVTFDYKQEFDLTVRVTEEIRKAGLPDPVPVFHGDVDTKLIRKYLDLGYPIVGLSGLDRPERRRLREKMQYLDECFAELCDDKGKPRVKIHGFAVAVPDIISAYPWWSVDTASWAYYSSYGRVIIPNFEGHGYKPIKISRDDHDAINNNCYWLLSPHERHRIDKLFEKHGYYADKFTAFKTEGIQERATWNAYMLEQIVSSVPTEFRRNPATLFT